ncbi:carbohydrate ABC transporter permease [Kitasatospora purpeofusca]|uniref:carbohydrate ABC transporter permease n=1 Tax=Kitasatospora purpeofusca TaxID=67352 RepID=UPI003690564E
MSTITPSRRARPATAAPARHAARAARPRRPWTPLLTANGILVVFTLYTLLPIAWLLVAATKSAADLYRHPGFELGSFNLVGNLADLFTAENGIFLRWMGNSLLYSVVGSLAGTMISVLAGYAFDKYEFRGREKLYAVVLLGVLIPFTVIQLPIYLMFSKLGLVNTYWAILLPSLVNPFGVYLARTFSQGYIPNEVIEAARVDGAGEWQTFRTICLPMLRPGFVTIFLFAFTASWNGFLTAMVMVSDTKLFPVALGLYTWNKSSQINPEYSVLVVAGALVVTVPLVIAFVCLQRYWRSGMTAGAVK